MRHSIQRLLGDLQTLVGELEESCKSDAALAGLGETGDRVKKKLSQVREQIQELERNVRSGVRRGVRTADSYVHSNPWKSIAIAAAVAFIAGALVARSNAEKE